jgi:methyl-accepting chemotaxis protein
MLSLDVEDRLRRNTLKWFIYGTIALVMAIIILVIETPQKIHPTILTIFITLLIFVLIVYLIGIFNLSIWLKIKKAIDTYHQGNYDKAKEIAVSAYKMSNSKEIKDLINYIDSQIIDDIVSEQERIENPDAEDNEMLQEINDQIEEILTRIKKLAKIKQEIAHKLNEVKHYQQEQKDIKDQYSKIIKQYTELQKFSEFRISSYRQILNKLHKLKEKHTKISQLWEEKEDLKDLQEELAAEGFKSDQQSQAIEKFFQNETEFLEYTKEFLATSNTIEDPDEFHKLYKELLEKLEELEEHHN